MPKVGQVKVQPDGQLVYMGLAAGGVAIYEIKVFEDDEANVIKNRAFVWEIPEDLDGAIILKAGGFVTTTGGDTTVSITKVGGGSVLSGNIEIDGGELSSKTGNTPDANFEVAYGDQLEINTLSAGGQGLGIWVAVGNASVAGAVIRGQQGPPGGVANWQGQHAGTGPQFQGNWGSGTSYTTGQTVLSGGQYYVATSDHTSGATTEPGVGANWMTVWQLVTYTTGDAVNSGGSSYVARVDNPTTVPGVTPGWEDEWQLLTDGAHKATLGVTISAGFYNVQPGYKGAMRMPYGGTIQGVYVLADKSGSATIDVRKTTILGWPPDSGDSITGGSPLVLSGASHLEDTALGGWDTTFDEGDIISFMVTSYVTTIGMLSINLDIERV